MLGSYSEKYYHKFYFERFWLSEGKNINKTNHRNKRNVVSVSKEYGKGKLNLTVRIWKMLHQSAVILDRFLIRNIYDFSK